MRCTIEGYREDGYSKVTSSPPSPSSPSPSSPSSPSPSSCTNVRNWKDKKWKDKTRIGRTCKQYEDNKWCVGGKKGTGWKSSWGAFSKYSDGKGVDPGEACCACGGGT